MRSRMDNDFDFPTEVKYALLKEIIIYRNQFFVIRLIDEKEQPQLPPTDDCDACISSELESSDWLLLFAKKRKLSFSTLHLAQFASMHLLAWSHYERTGDCSPMHTVNQCEWQADQSPLQ